MRQFRQGGHNTLVSTCVGEEGLDIGEVDLIVCFDANKSPIRWVGHFLLLCAIGALVGGALPVAWCYVHWWVGHFLMLGVMCTGGWGTS